MSDDVTGYLPYKFLKSFLNECQFGDEEDFINSRIFCVSRGVTMIFTETYADPNRLQRRN